jgi:hypothetical protein
MDSCILLRRSRTSFLRLGLEWPCIGVLGLGKISRKGFGGGYERRERSERQYRVYVVLCVWPIMIVSAQIVVNVDRHKLVTVFKG